MTTAPSDHPSILATVGFFAHVHQVRAAAELAEVGSDIETDSGPPFHASGLNLNNRGPAPVAVVHCYSRWIGED